MKTGIVNYEKLYGIANRLRIAPKSMREQIIRELIEAIDEGSEPAPRNSHGRIAPGVCSSIFRAMFQSEDPFAESGMIRRAQCALIELDAAEGADGPTADALRAMLEWEEVKGNPRATGRIARMLIDLRDKV